MQFSQYAPSTGDTFAYFNAAAVGSEGSSSSAAARNDTEPSVIPISAPPDNFKKSRRLISFIMLP